MFNYTQFDEDKVDYIEIAPVDDLPDGERLFVCPAHPEKVLEGIGDDLFNRDEQLPYWAEHWPSTEAAVHYLSGSPPPRGSLVCDLGCGLGVLSAAAAQGGAEVVSADISAAACAFARTNLRAQGLPDRVLCADWRAVPLRGVFDTVVAADVLYEKRWVEPVLACIGNLLVPDGAAYVADPCRRHWPLFREYAERNGYLAATVCRETVNDGLTTVEVLKLSRQ